MPGMHGFTDALSSGLHRDRHYRLVLLRHAKAEHPGGIADAMRPLALVGRRQAAGVGTELRDLGLVPESVLCSSALRTRQTWELAATKLGGSPQVSVSDDIYEAGVSDVLSAVRMVDPHTRTVLVVGHEPTMAATAFYLADAAASDPGALAQVRVGVPTAAYSVLESTIAWPQWGQGVSELRMVGRPAV